MIHNSSKSAYLKLMTSLSKSDIIITCTLNAKHVFSGMFKVDFRLDKKT